MVTATRRQETREQAIARLAQRARESGVAIRRDFRDGRHYVSSASQRGHWHYCTAVSCDCKGFVSHGRCMHHSLLLVHLGWADEDPTPEPTLSVSAGIPGRCSVCNGAGTHPGTISIGRSWTYANVTCESCHGTGRQIAA